MNNPKRLKTKFATIFSFIILLLSCVSCGKSNNPLYISYIDADGKLIEYCIEDDGYDPSHKTLPSDTKDWHYVEWEISRDGNNVTCIARRVTIQKYIWKDNNGTILHEEILYGENNPIQKPLPSSSGKWVYTEWQEEISGNTTTYVTNKIPNDEYFKGNVFQIVVSDNKGEPVSTGSGFIINDQGWFITNHHVMENAYSAKAYFDIIDNEEGFRYTQLEITGKVFDSAEKDIYIGKLNGYQKIKAHYKPIPFTEDYTQGETSYTIGYPNSSVDMEINSGKILEEYSDIYSKVNNVFYILSDSYIAPGSSGGILINEQFEVIGITTIGLYADNNQTVYIAGGSIPTFVFKKYLTDLNKNNLIPLS